MIIQLVDGEEFTREAKNIEQQIRQFRPEMIFRIETGELDSTVFVVGDSVTQICHNRVPLIGHSIVDYCSF